MCLTKAKSSLLKYMCMKWDSVEGGYLRAQVALLLLLIIISNISFPPPKSIAEELICLIFGEQLLLLESDICLLTPHLGFTELCPVSLTFIYTKGKH